MVKVKIKKLNDNAVVPRYAHSTDAGLDLTATEVRETSKFIEYKTGLAVEIPKGYMGLLFPRSSISRYDLVLANSVGVIDSGYRGEILIRFQKFGEDVYKVGERVAQLIVMPHPLVELEVVDDLDESERSMGGFGSTGSN